MASEEHLLQGKQFNLTAAKKFFEGKAMWCSC
jgi:hypothetical protein